MTVRQWFRIVRAATFEQPETDITVRFAIDHRKYYGVEVDIRNLHDIQALIDTPPVLQMTTYARIIGVVESYEYHVHRRELLMGLKGLME